MRTAFFRYPFGTVIEHLLSVDNSPKSIIITGPMFNVDKYSKPDYARWLRIHHELASYYRSSWVCFSLEYCALSKDKRFYRRVLVWSVNWAAIIDPTKVEYRLVTPPNLIESKIWGRLITRLRGRSCAWRGCSRIRLGAAKAVPPFPYIFALFVWSLWDLCYFGAASIYVRQRYLWNAEVSIKYFVIGDYAVDLIWVVTTAVVLICLVWLFA